MKVKALSRSTQSTQRECVGDVRPQHRSLAPTSHPHAKAREYTRAVQSAKLDRIFAKPFVGALEGGHADGITVMGTSRTNLTQFVSGSVDGVVKVWDLARRKCVTTYQRAHGGVVTGLQMCDFNQEGSASLGGASGVDLSCLSCGEDGKIHQWKLLSSDNDSDGLVRTWDHPNTKHGGSFKSLDIHWHRPIFATASDSAVDVWSPERSSPTQSYTTNHLWGDGDTINCVRFNPSEQNLLAHCSMDRGVGLHDVRLGTNLRKTILAMRSNCLEWNPLEPMNFVVGNEDHNCYGFDMRKLDRPTIIHKGHVGAVLSISWSPTGREFVSGSYDKTIRIFGYRSPQSREMYYSKRMQRIFAVQYTHDDKYVLSGSDDTNIRLWRARASEQVGIQLTSRESKSLQYRKSLVSKYKHMPEIRQIERSGKRRGPKLIKKMRALERVQTESERRKQENRVKHSKPGTVKYTNERDKAVVKQID